MIVFPSFLVRIFFYYSMVFQPIITMNNWFSGSLCRIKSPIASFSSTLYNCALHAFLIDLHCVLRIAFSYTFVVFKSVKTLNVSVVVFSLLVLPYKDSPLCELEYVLSSVTASSCLNSSSPVRTKICVYFISLSSVRFSSVKSNCWWNSLLLVYYSLYPCLVLVFSCRQPHSDAVPFRVILYYFHQVKELRLLQSCAHTFRSDLLFLHVG